MPSTYPSIDSYVQAVLSHIPHASSERTRIEEDLRSHIAERVEAGSSLADAIAAMGAPGEVAQSYLGDRPLVYASLVRRAAAFALDSIVLGLPGALVIVGFYCAYEANPGLSDGIGMAFIPMFMLLFVFLFFYFPVMEAKYGQTLGKRWMGMMVVTESGLAIGWWAAFVRRIPMLFNVAIVLDAAFALLGEKHQRAFDRVANTVVVQVA